MEFRTLLSWKTARFVAATVLLGAIGSGTWEWLLKPFLMGASEIGLNIATLGVQSFKDSLYKDVAQGFHEGPSLRLYVAVFSGVPAFILGVVSGIAAVNSYQCVISEQQLLDKNGALKRPPEPYLIGQRFAVDRNTGHIVGPEQALWQLEDHKITVLARGNADNSFIVVSVGPARGNGVHATMLRIEEFAQSKSKPFVVLSSSVVTAGVCE